MAEIAGLVVFAAARRQQLTIHKMVIAGNAKSAAVLKLAVMLLGMEECMVIAPARILIAVREAV